MPDTNYDSMTDDEFDAILCQIVDKKSASTWMTIYPGIYEILREELNNEVLSAWEVQSTN